MPGYVLALHTAERIVRSMNAFMLLDVLFLTRCDGSSSYICTVSDLDGSKHVLGTAPSCRWNIHTRSIGTGSVPDAPCGDDAASSPDHEW